MGKDTPLYRVVFTQEDKIYEVYAQSLSEESLMGFIEIEEFVLDAESTSPTQESTEDYLKSEFAGVKRSYIPMHMILRIDEMEVQGVKVEKNPSNQDNIHQFPSKHKKPVTKKDV
jgi:hypothetical protein